MAVDDEARALDAHGVEGLAPGADPGGVAGVDAGEQAVELHGHAAEAVAERLHPTEDDFHELGEAEVDGIPALGRPGSVEVEPAEVRGDGADGLVIGALQGAPRTGPIFAPRRWTS